MGNTAKGANIISRKPHIQRIKDSLTNFGH